MLRDVLFKGMLRELLEEPQVRRGESVEGSQYVTGYFRWLSRGAEPEFTWVVRLNVTLADLERWRGKGTGKNYTEGRFAVPVSLLQTSLRHFRSTCPVWSRRRHPRARSSGILLLRAGAYQ